MVKGIDKLAEILKEYSDNYVIIGGTACEILLLGTSMRPRATKDIDMVLVVEKMTEDFKSTLTRFFKAGGYKCNKRKGRANDSSDYEMYRFTTDNSEYPFQIELLSVHSDLFGNQGEFNIEPVVGEDEEVTSLSAIILDGDYYNLLVSTKEMQHGLSIASRTALICLKAYAHTNLLKDKNAGRHVNDRDIKKHKTDVLKLIATGSFPNMIYVPKSICDTIMNFVDIVSQPSEIKPFTDALQRPEEDIRAFIDILQHLFLPLKS